MIERLIATFVTMFLLGLLVEGIIFGIALATLLSLIYITGYSIATHLDKKKRLKK